MRKIFLALLVLSTANIGLASDLDLSLVNENSTVELAEFDRIDPGDFYADFPEEFERPENIGSYSFTDSSLVTPNLFISYSSSQVLDRESLDIYYASVSGDLRRPISTQEAVLEGDSGTANIEISSFEALFPGKIFGKLKGDEEVHEIDGGLFTGNYSVAPDTSFADSSTDIDLEKAFTEESEIHERRGLSGELYISILRNGTVLSEDKTVLGGTESLDTALQPDDRIYVNSLMSLEVKDADPCSVLDQSNSYYVINETVFDADPHGAGGGNKSCLLVEDAENLTLDFGENNLDGDGNFSDTEACGLRIKDSDNIAVKDMRIQEFSRGLCVENSSDVSIPSGDSLQENRIGTYVKNSDLSMKQTVSSNSFRELSSAGETDVDLEGLVYDSASISLTGINLDIDSVDDAPEDPSGLENTGQWIEIDSDSVNGFIQNLSFRNIGDTELVYSFGSRSELESDFSENIVFSEEIDTEAFGVIGLYRERDEEEDEEDESTDPGDGGAGGGGGGIGAPPGDPPPSETPGEGPPELPGGLSPGDTPNVSIVADESITVEQGRTAEIDYVLEVNGAESGVDITVAGHGKNGWDITSKAFDSILPGEEEKGRMLVDVFNGEVLGTYQIRLEASKVIDGLPVSLDNETVEVEVVPRSDVRDINVLEAPYRLNITERTVKVLSFDMRNTGDYRLENVELSGYDIDKCLPRMSGSWSFDEDIRETLNYTVRSGKAGGSCEGAFILSSDKEDLLAVVPAEINVIERTLSQKLRNNILPFLVLIWTVFTAYWIRRKHYEQKN